MGSAAMKDLEQFLLGRAMEHHSPGLLFTVAAEYRISAKTIRPGMVTPSLRRQTMIFLHGLPSDRLFDAFIRRATSVPST
jgi:hypothetical protein